MAVGGIFGQTLFVIVALVILYYFYKYLFASTGLTSLVLLNGTMAANPTSALKTTSNLPALYEGGEYSVNIWIYINDWSIRRGYNKHVLSIGGAGFLTFALYLKPYTNALGVTVRTSDLNGLSSGNISQTTTPTGTTTCTTTPNSGSSRTSSSSSGSDNLTNTNLSSFFNAIQGMPGGVVTDPPCDIPSIDLQKWVQVTLTLNNKTTDVYIDGKLARSCILPTFYRVDPNNISLNICDWGGFGGYVSNATAYNSTLNPDQVWQLYMNGPGPQYSFIDYWNSLFNPASQLQLGYPKMNVVG